MIEIFREAKETDVEAIVQMLIDDDIARSRETTDSLDSYYAAFKKITSDKNNLLIVVELDKKIVGTLQITFITYLSYQGGKHALIEGVRVDRSLRGKGLGRKMLQWAIETAKQNGCHMVQLTSDKRRSDARRFYESLGFVASHEGFKLLI